MDRNKTEEKFFVSVAAVVESNEKILVIQRNDNKEWQIPGGLLEEGENIYSGLNREVYEETGIDIEKPQLTGIYYHIIQGTVAMVFRCKLKGGEITLSEESIKVEWKSYQEIEQLFNPTFTIRVKDAIFGTGVNIRHHNGINIIE